MTRGQLQASKPDILNDKLPDDAKRVYVSNDHMGNFMKGVKTRTAPICRPRSGTDRPACATWGDCHPAGAQTALGRSQGAVCG